MNKFKKLALFCLSLMTALTVMAGCNLINNSGSSLSDSTALESSSVEESSSEDSSHLDYSTDSESSEDDSSESESDDSNSNSSSDNNSSSSGDNTSDNNSSSDSGNSGDDEEPEENPYKDVAFPSNTLTGDCVCGEWHLIKEATCTEEGGMVRVCTKDATHMEAVAFDARGHNYGNNGLCDCGAEPTLPTLPNSGYVNITNPESGISKSGQNEDPAYSRYIVNVDEYYTAETEAYSFKYYDAENNFQLVSESGYACWIQFSIPSFGQYAVVTKGNPNNITLTRYDGNSGNVNKATPLASRELADGSLISTVNVSPVYYSQSGDLDSWIGICCFKGTEAGQTVDFTIVRIDDPAWLPETIYENITAKDIDGKLAPEGASGTVATEVPYETNGIYFDTEKGYYCMPGGEIIYAAITKKASRQFAGGTVAFSDLLGEGSESNFKVHSATLPNGNYLVYNYATMLLSNPYGEGYNDNSYQAKVNSDGLYPVTKELYDFLVIHAKNHPPITGPSAEYADNTWLSVCYYYKELDRGSASLPFELEFDSTVSEPQTFTVKQYALYTEVYFNLRSDVSTLCSLTITTPNVKIWVGDKTYTNQGTNININNIVFEIGPSPILVKCLNSTSSLAEIEVTLTAVSGSFNNPITVEANGQPIVMQPIQINTTDAIEYEVYYVYEITQSGTLTLTADTDASIIIGGISVENGSATYVATYDAETPENNFIKICVVSTNADAINATLTFTA